MRAIRHPTLDCNYKADDGYKDKAKCLGYKVAIH